MELLPQGAAFLLDVSVGVFWREGPLDEIYQMGYHNGNHLKSDNYGRGREGGFDECGQF